MWPLFSVPIFSIPPFGSVVASAYPSSTVNKCTGFFSGKSRERDLGYGYMNFRKKIILAALRYFFSQNLRPFFHSRGKWFTVELG